jgi:cytochrome oxidase assembly protein ShyY1
MPLPRKYRLFSTLTPPAYLKKSSPAPRRLSPYLYIFPLTAGGLFLWQLARLQKKQELISQLEEGLYSPPVLYSKGFKGGENKRILVRGRYLKSRRMRLGPKSMEGMSGTDDITPMKLEDG